MRPGEGGADWPWRPPIRGPREGQELLHRRPRYVAAIAGLLYRGARWRDREFHFRSPAPKMRVLRQILASEPPGRHWLKMAHRQDMVGIVDRMLPLTGRAGGAPRPKRGHLHRSQLTCGTETSPPEGRGSRSDWRVKKRFTPRVVTFLARSDRGQPLPPALLCSVPGSWIKLWPARYLWRCTVPRCCRRHSPQNDCE